MVKTRLLIVPLFLVLGLSLVAFAPLPRPSSCTMRSAKRTRTATNIRLRIFVPGSRAMRPPRSSSARRSWPLSQLFLFPNRPIRITLFSTFF